jgi:hypothetical protein
MRWRGTQRHYRTQPISTPLPRRYDYYGPALHHFRLSKPRIKIADEDGSHLRMNLKRHQPPNCLLADACWHIHAW